MAGAGGLAALNCPGARGGTPRDISGLRPGEKAWQAGLTLLAGTIAALAVAILALLAIGTRFVLHGDGNAVHALLSLFFSIILLVCWEVCLFLRRDYLEERTEYRRMRRQDTGRAPTRDFLATGVRLTGVLSRPGSGPTPMQRTPSTTAPMPTAGRSGSWWMSGKGS